MLELLQDMSLEEKIYQLVQMPGECFEQGILTGPAAEMGIPQEKIYQAGSCLTVIGAKTLREIQDKAMAAQPHHIPMLFMCDIINGYRTVYPVPLAQGCTFDPDLVRDCAKMAAAESAASGVHVTFSPMADLVRDARWGRVMESTGEDPYLNGLMAKAMVEGYQGDDLQEKGRIAACVKHFAGYGAPTAGRDYNTVELSERTLYEDYLPAYKAALDAKCALVMTSFNTLNRIPSSGNKALMRDLLRDEWGFDGVVISDWAAIYEMLPHGIAANGEEAARLAIEAGVDIDMVTSIYSKNLYELAADGRIPMALVDEAVLRVLELKNKLGLFEHPYKDASEDDENALLLCDAHRAVAGQCASESFVLLKNDEGILPLSREKKIALIGPYVNSRLITGSWSFFSKDEDNRTIHEVLQEQYGDCFATATGCELLEAGRKLTGFSMDYLNEETEEEAKEKLDKAVALAREAEVVVLFLGEPKDFTGEGASRADITIPALQKNLLRSVAAVNPNVVTVLFNGRPLDLREESALSKAILDVWFPGTEGARAILDMLFGVTAPSGKLSMSFPFCVGQVPVFYNEFSTGRPFFGDYREGRFFSKYIDIPNEPLYPFGYGLTYTSFSYSDVTVSKPVLSIAGEDSLTATVTLTNTGSREGTEVVQLYIRDLAGSVVRPVRELKDFTRVTLAAGEARDVTFTITPSMLQFYDIDMEFTAEPGEFMLFVGGDSRTQNAAAFTLVV